MSVCVCPHCRGEVSMPDLFVTEKRILVHWPPKPCDVHTFWSNSWLSWSFYNPTSPVVLHTLWNHRENLWESFVMSLFVRSTVCSSLLVFKMRCSVAAAAHKSWPPWLCSRNPLLRPTAKPHCDVGKPSNVVQMRIVVKKLLNSRHHPGIVKASQFRKIWKVVRVRY